MTTTSVFVYGTLQRGECRCEQWPLPPVDVHIARVRGLLYDLGPYPALTDGQDWVVGERWDFERADLPETLRVLDAIEGYANTANDLYCRRLIDCYDQEDQSSSAFTYYYGQPDRLPQIGRRVMPDGTGRCRWRGEPNRRLMRPP